MWQTPNSRLFPEPETASPEKPTILHRDGVRVERIDRIGLELGTQWKSQYHVEENGPLIRCRTAQYPDRVAKRMANPGRDADAAVIHGQRLSASGKFERLGGRERSVSSRLGSFYSSRFLMIAELASSMSQVQVDQKTYQMPPQDGFTVAYFLTVADIERSARFYETVFGGRILSRGPPGYIQIANTWIARKWSDDSVRSMSWPQRRRSSGQRLSLR